MDYAEITDIIKEALKAHGLTYHLDKQVSGEIDIIIDPEDADEDFTIGIRIMEVDLG